LKKELVVSKERSKNEHRNPFLLNQEELSKRESSSKGTEKYPASSTACIEDPESMKAWHSLMKDDRNVIRTTSLFFESKREENPTNVPIFTLKDFDYSADGVVYIALKPIYFSYEHIPNFEYDFAMDVFGSWEIWIKQTKSSLRNEFQAWRDELDIKIKAKAIKSMMEASLSNDAKGVAAAKYLADKGYVEGGTKRGRPSKEDVERERKQQADIRDTLASDMERLGMSIAK
jgi:hypothetical protein